MTWSASLNEASRVRQRRGADLNQKHDQKNRCVEKKYLSDPIKTPSKVEMRTFDASARQRAFILFHSESHEKVLGGSHEAQE